MTSKQLADIAHDYMRRLGLEEWITKSEIRFATKKKMKNNVGRAGWSAERKYVWIQVAMPQTLKADEPRKPLDRVIREDLLHELLHLRLEGHAPPTEVYEPQYEFALNKLTELLYEAWIPR